MTAVAETLTRDSAPQKYVLSTNIYLRVCMVQLVLSVKALATLRLEVLLVQTLFPTKNTLLDHGSDTAKNTDGC